MRFKRSVSKITQVSGDENPITELLLKFITGFYIRDDIKFDQIL